MTFDPEKNLEAIIHSPVYRRAEDDMDFIRGLSMRPMRLAMELMKAEEIQTEWGINSTIVMFGGTRIIEREHAERRLEGAKQLVAARPNDAAAKRELMIAERVLAKSGFYDEARKFAYHVTKQCQHEGTCLDNVIVTGGGPGIMEAGNRGAVEAGGVSIGLNITLPHEQEPNPYITPELCFQFHYFAIRKMHFLIRARAMLAFPGGFGTMDEIFETLTLIQTQTMRRIPIILFGREYWERIVNFSAFMEEGTIAPQDLDLFCYAETAEEAWAIISQWYAEHGIPHQSPIHR